MARIEVQLVEPRRPAPCATVASGRMPAAVQRRGEQRVGGGIAGGSVRAGRVDDGAPAARPERAWASSPGQRRLVASGALNRLERRLRARPGRLGRHAGRQREARARPMSIARRPRRCRRRARRAAGATSDSKSPPTPVRKRPLSSRRAADERGSLVRRSTRPGASASAWLTSASVNADGLPEPRLAAQLEGRDHTGDVVRVGREYARAHAAATATARGAPRAAPRRRRSRCCRPKPPARAPRPRLRAGPAARRTAWPARRGSAPAAAHRACSPIVTASCTRTTTRHSQGRRRAFASARAGVNSHGKSGRSNSIAREAVGLEVARAGARVGADDLPGVQTHHVGRPAQTHLHRRGRNLVDHQHRVQLDGGMLGRAEGVHVRRSRRRRPGAPRAGSSDLQGSLRRPCRVLRSQLVLGHHLPGGCGYGSAPGAAARASVHVNTDVPAGAAGSPASVATRPAGGAQRGRAAPACPTGSARRPVPRIAALATLCVLGAVAPGGLPMTTYAIAAAWRAARPPRRQSRSDS